MYLYVVLVWGLCSVHWLKMAMDLLCQSIHLSLLLIHNVLSNFRMGSICCCVFFFFYTPGRGDLSGPGWIGSKILKYVGGKSNCTTIKFLSSLGLDQVILSLDWIELIKLQLQCVRFLHLIRQIRTWCAKTLHFMWTQVKLCSSTCCDALLILCLINESALQVFKSNSSIRCVSPNHLLKPLRH